MSVCQVCFCLSLISRLYGGGNCWHRLSGIYKNYSASHFIEDLANKADRLLDVVFQLCDVNYTFNAVLQTTLDSHARVKTIKIRSRPCPFVNKDIRILMRSRDSLHRRFLRSRTEADWNNIQSASKVCEKIVLGQFSDYVISKKTTLFTPNWK